MAGQPTPQIDLNESNEDGHLPAMLYYAKEIHRFEAMYFKQKPLIMLLHTYGIAFLVPATKGFRLRTLRPGECNRKKISELVEICKPALISLPNELY